MADRVIWKSEDGYERCSSKLEKTMMEFENICTIDDWKRVVKNRDSKVELSCLSCQVSGALSVHNIMNGTSIGCWCNNLLRVTSVDYRSEFLRVVDKMGLQLINISSFAEWKATIKSSKTSVNVRCKACKTVQKSTLKKLMQELKPLCPCAENFGWSQKASFERFCNFVDSSRFDWVEKPNYASWTVLVKNVKSPLVLKCSKCEMEVESSIVNFIHHGAGCDCSNSTESTVKYELESIAGLNKLEVVPQFSFDSLLGVGGLPLKFDFALLAEGKPAMLGEVDGPHHFDRSFSYGGSTERFRTHNDIEHDLLKERYCKLHGISMFRIDVETARREKSSWRNWLRLTIAQDLKRSGPPSVYRLSHRGVYDSGDYARVRVV